MPGLKLPPRIRLSVVFTCAIAFPVAPLCLAQDRDKPAPTYKDVSYGPHERNVLDFWQSKSDEPTPLVVYIHGGGFRNGNKESVDAATLRALLEAKISVAALNYRFVTQAPLPAAHDDCRRGLQFLRSKAKEWSIRDYRG